METDQPKPIQAEDSVELVENDPTPAIETLMRIHHVPRAADLHPNLAFADKAWPSPSFGPVLPGVLEQLRRARGVSIMNGFKVDADPVNPTGDGKSWGLIVETDNLPKGANPIELARHCQSRCVPGAAQPRWEGQTILVPLWDSGSLSPQNAFDMPSVTKADARDAQTVARSYADETSKDLVKDSAVLEKRVARLERRTDTRKPKYHSIFKPVIYKCLLSHPNATTQVICAYVDEQFGYRGTENSWILHRHKKTRQHNSHLATISKVRKDLGLNPVREESPRT